MVVHFQARSIVAEETATSLAAQAEIRGTWIYQRDRYFGRGVVGINSTGCVLFSSTRTRNDPCQYRCRPIKQLGYGKRGRKHVLQQLVSSAHGAVQS